MQVERVLTALPSTQASLASASQQADEVLSEVKKLEIRAMLTDQTIEEMEAQLYEAHNMSANTAQKAEDMTRKLQVRTKEMGRAQDRAEQASSKLEQVTNKLRAADIKVRSEILLFQHFNIIIDVCSRWRGSSSTWRTGRGWTGNTKTRLEICKPRSATLTLGSPGMRRLC